MLVWVLVPAAVVSALVILHECGHYLVARLLRIQVERFSIGFGPAIFARTSKTTGTTFRLRLFPFGGFVRIRGMDHADSAPVDRDAYTNRPIWQQLATIVAGPAASYLVVVMLAMALYNCHGVDIPRWYGVGKVLPDYDAYGKLESGDRILAVDHVPLYIDSGPRLTDRVAASKGAPIVLTIERDGQKHDIEIWPREENYRMGKSVWRLGVHYQQQDLVVHVGVFDAAQRSLVYPVEETKQMVKAFYGIVFGSETADPGGPIRMADEFYHAFSAGIVPGLKLLMVFSVYIGLLLAAPIPLFDGGRFVFLIYRVVVTWSRSVPHSH